MRSVLAVFLVVCLVGAVVAEPMRGKGKFPGLAQSLKKGYDARSNLLSRLPENIQRNLAAGAKMNLENGRRAYPVKKFGKNLDQIKTLKEEVTKKAKEGLASIRDGVNSGKQDKLNKRRPFKGGRRILQGRLSN